MLLQLAHPWVAAAIEQHSDTFADPISRFHRTFSVVFTMVFGRLEQSLQAARRLHRRHVAISGTMQLAAIPGQTTPKGRAGSLLKGRKVPPKYRSPSGETWAGRGQRPKCMVAALKKGKKMESFLIKRR